MSDWLNKLSPASFRGLPFYLLEPPEAEVGRNSADHEYAGRDEPYSEDMGRKQRSYTIAGGVDGADFIAKAHKLQDAFEEEGPGLLVHPHYGELYVTVVARIRFEGRFASFQLTCKEAGHNENPTRTIDSKQAITDKAITAEAAAIKSFADGYDVSGPAFIEQEALEQITDLLSTFALDSSSSSLSTDVASQIRQPQELAATLFNNIASLKQSAASPLEALSSYQAIGGSQIASTEAATTPSRQKIAANQLATTNLFKQSAAINAATAMVDVNFEHQAQANQAATDTAALIEDVSWQADDSGYRALSDLRVAVQQDMQARTPALPKLQTVNLPQTMPALVAAYRYTGTADNEQQIIDRNRVQHPGFIHGDIEVINV